MKPKSLTEINKEQLFTLANMRLAPGPHQQEDKSRFFVFFYGDNKRKVTSPYIEPFFPQAASG